MILKNKYLFIGGLFLNIALSAHDLSTGSYIALPSSLSKKSNITHIKVKQIPYWSCGYNVLYNACMIENTFGRGSKYSNLKLFMQRCFSYIKQNLLNTQESTSNKDIEELAKKLDLKHMCYLTTRKRIIMPMPSHKITVYCDYNTSPQEREFLFDQEFQRRGKEYMQAYKDIFINTPRGKSVCLHFCCQVYSQGEAHAILVSLVKNIQGKNSIYIADNLNEPLKQGCDAHRYVTYLINFFNL